ncbi:MAG: TIGR03546 family protein [Spirochaetales bacterium]|uniref:TIGR03546 family protein n=1 Tax=Candidatus Thalassospirochaeta sargassi TaxID=3119039 RepID=A0AAJ1MK20_9SPIO|nr:TIGR03546 family protein [Spirochaetales bacterium]
MFFIKPVAKLIVALNSNTKPGAVAAAVATAFLLALIPSLNLVWPLLFIISLIARLNWGFEFVFIAVFKLIVPLIDPFIEPMGWRLLQSGPVSSLVYNVNEIPGLIYFGFNDSLMIGGLLAGIIAWVPVFFLSRFIIVLFREKLSPRIANSKFIAAVKRFPILGKLIAAVKQFSEVY